MDSQNPMLSEQFDLLSAYLDGDVTAAERAQVEVWLAEDPQLQQTYRQLMALQDGLRSIPTEASTVPTEVMVNRVMSRLDQRARRWRGLGTAAAVVAGLFSSLLIANPRAVFQTANRSEPETPNLRVVPPPSIPPVAVDDADPSALMIALERPLVEIPVEPKVVPVAPDNKPVYSKDQPTDL